MTPSTHESSASRPGSTQGSTQGGNSPLIFRHVDRPEAYAATYTRAGVRLTHKGRALAETADLCDFPETLASLELSIMSLAEESTVTTWQIEDFIEQVEASTGEQIVGYDAAEVAHSSPFRVVSVLAFQQASGRILFFAKKDGSIHYLGHTGRSEG